jgi:hypothetical protein
MTKNCWATVNLDEVRATLPHLGVVSGLQNRARPI